MRNPSILLLLAWSALPMGAGEITTTYEVTLNGQKFNVNAEATTNVVVEGKELKLAARERPKKIFSDGNISFAFPAAHAVSKEIEGGVTTWTLDGQDNILILSKKKGLDLTDIRKEAVKALRQQYGDSSKQSSCKTMLGGEAVAGTKITAELAGEIINQEVYELKAGMDGYLLIIQDSGATESSETRAVKTLLNQTFKRTLSPAAKPAK